ncbi:MAG TPA: response regulator [Gemmatimonadaceae bacterium]
MMLSERAFSHAQRRRVLIADDNAEMRAFIRRLLADRYDVDVVANGRDALESARRARPDLLITDIVMPHLDGFGLLKAIRSDPALRTLPAIVLTERGEVDSRVEGLEAGADDYLVKPFSPRELLARVRTCMELSRMREEVERATGREEALREANRRKDDFLSMLAHELRNPLAPIGYGIHLLGLPEVSPQMLARTREMLERQVHHMARIVDDLLDVSRITSGKLSIVRERLDLARLVRQAIEDRRGTLEAAGLKIDAEFPNEPLWVMGDPTRLTQSFDNLLDNARKFTTSGGVVSVRVGHDAETRRAIVVVRDTGIGIEPSLLPHVFDVFAQAEQSLDRTRGGLGLGLAVTKGLIELHGGTITASSAGKGRGAEFTIRIPSEVEPAVLASTLLDAPGTAQPLRVLIVEDNVDAADILRTLLEYHGYTVSVAYTGLEGVTAAKSQRPDVVLCDIGLPGMDGYAVADALRQSPETGSVRLIAVTGYGREADKQRALASGFDLHLVKPVNAQQLLGHLVTVR